MVSILSLPHQIEFNTLTLLGGLLCFGNLFGHGSSPLTSSGSREASMTRRDGELKPLLVALPSESPLTKKVINLNSTLTKTHNTAFMPLLCGSSPCMFQPWHLLTPTGFLPNGKSKPPTSISFISPPKGQLILTFYFVQACHLHHGH
jgi:hypothetical protein